MAEIAVEAAIFIIDKIVAYLISANYERRERHDIDSTKNWLKAMQAYLKDTQGIQEFTAGLQDRVRYVRDVAFEIEDVIEEFMLAVPQHTHEHMITKFFHDVSHSVTDKIPLRQLNSRVKTVKAKIEDIDKMDRIRLLPSQSNAPSSCSGEALALVCYPKVMDDELIGIEKRIDELLKLIKGESWQMVISVIGSRGSGKTTLIKEVYENLKDGFDCHALITAPHPVREIPDKICAAMNLPVRQGTDAKDRLHFYLQEKKYRVVLDGIWNKDEWNYIQTVLPNGFPGSRTIISTDKQDACYSAGHGNLVYHLKPLTWEEGWKLFCKKTFGSTQCPQHLVDCSERIVKRCEGLTLAIVDVASLLLNKPQTKLEFEKFHDNLGHELGRNDQHLIMGKILQQSYRHLPHNLKCCFLYFCNFPEDYSVTRGRLVRLWVAEQFVEVDGGGKKTLEDTANEYLSELIEMNLVHVSRRDAQGRVKSCRVLNLVREFILYKSENENFCRVFTGTNKSLGEQPRRVSLHSFGNNKLPKTTDISRVRTLMTFGSDSCTTLMAEKPLEELRFLRVLDLEDATLEHFPEEVVHLTLLRYLSLRNTKIKTVPRTVKKLQSLVTLDLRQTCIKKLPKGIRKLRNLLCLLVDRMDENEARLGAVLPPGIGNLTSLHKLSLVKANSKHRIVRELENLVGLRKLGITELARENGMDLFQAIGKMKHLTSLYLTLREEEELLDLDGLGKPPQLLCNLYLGGRLPNIPQWISSLHGLAKICLKG